MNPEITDIKTRFTEYIAWLVEKNSRRNSLLDRSKFDLIVEYIQDAINAGKNGTAVEETATGIAYHVVHTLDHNRSGDVGHSVMVMNEILHSYTKKSGSVYPGNLLTDLMHWCAENRFDFDNSLKYARTQYEVELTVQTE